MKAALLFLSLALISIQLHAQVKDDCLLEEKTIDDKPALVIELSDDRRIIELDSVLKKNGYKYKGFRWDNGLWEVVNQKDFGMLLSIEEIDEKEDRLVVVFKNSETRIRFSKLMCPVLDNPAELDAILANRKKY